MKQHEIEPNQTRRQRVMHSFLEDERERREADRQLFLFLGNDNLPKIDRSQPPPTYTGERLFRDRPEIYRLVVELLSEPGISTRQICRVCHVSDDTVEAVAQREQIPISAQKEKTLKTLRRVIRLTTERLVELAPTMSAHDAAIALGISVEKHELLSGGVTSRVETVSGESLIDRFREFHEQTEKLVHATVISSQTGSGSGKEPQKALADSPAIVPASAPCQQSPELAAVSRTPTEQPENARLQSD